MSKSGLFAHFQSRDNLQIAVLTHSAEVFRERVIQPVRQQGHATQQEKLLALLQAWLAWNQSFAGRCMFLDAWTSAQEGEVQQAARELVRFWLDYLARQVVQGRRGEWRSDLDPLARRLSPLWPLSRGSGVPCPGAQRGSGPPLLARGGTIC
jgi:AcrR family transcriptional regulator